MAKIILHENDHNHLNSDYPTLNYSMEENSISGLLPFDLVYTSGSNIRIKDVYRILFKLETAEGSILPSVFETEGKIVKIAKRKGIDIGDLHLNSKTGELCLMVPILEKDKYPNDFELDSFLKHIQEHLYWVTYYDRYNTEPWKGQSHGENGYKELYWQNSRKYGCKVKEYFEKKLNTPLSRAEFRRLMKNKKK